MGGFASLYQGNRPEGLEMKTCIALGYVTVGTTNSAGMIQRPDTYKIHNTVIDLRNGDVPSATVPTGQSIRLRWRMGRRCCRDWAFL